MQTKRPTESVPVSGARSIRDPSPATKPDPSGPDDPAAPVAPSVLWTTFIRSLCALTVALVLALGYLFFGPSEISPYAWTPEVDPSTSGPYVPNDDLTRGFLLGTQWIEPGLVDRNRYIGVGPETIALGPDGQLYTGLCDGVRSDAAPNPPPCRSEGEAQGWVARVNPNRPFSVSPYVRTGGRPLGLSFDAKGRLYIADGRRGLLRVESDLSGGPAADREAEVAADFHAVVQVATCNLDDDAPDPQPTYADSVFVAPSGHVWFTCPSQRWPLEKIANDIFEGRPTGRVFRYDPCDADDPLTCPKSLEADDLMYANGIVLTKAGKLLVNEWMGFRVLEFSLNSDEHVESHRVFFDNLPGYPDNITIDDDGTVWLGLSIRRQPVIDRFRPHPFLMTALSRLPTMHLQRDAWIVGITAEGKPKWSLQDFSGFFNQATGAYPVGDALYIGSYTETGILCITKPGKPAGGSPCRRWDERPTSHPAYYSLTEEPQP